MTGEDALSLLYFLAIWAQPAAWMFIYYIKSSRFNNAIPTISPTALIIILFMNLHPYFYELKTTWEFIPLFSLYGGLGLIFTNILMVGYKWNAPQAISASALIAFIGSFYWEVPYLVRNAFVTGPQWDWLLHPMFLLYVWFLSVTVGWGRKHRVTLVASGILISVLFMLNWNIPAGVGGGAIWNSPYYLLNRAICVGIVFTMINKSKPTE